MDGFRFAGPGAVRSFADQAVPGEVMLKISTCTAVGILVLVGPGVEGCCAD